MKIHNFYLEDLELVARYENLFSKCDFAYFQQSISWAISIKNIGPDIPMFLLCEIDNVDVAGVPIYLFYGKYGKIMTSVPQPGPAGGIFHLPSLKDNVKYNIYKFLINKIIKVSETNKCILLSINTNQIFRDSAIYQDILKPNYVLNNFTQFINLGNKQKRSSSLKHNVNSSMKNNLEFFIDDQIIFFESWYIIHKKRNEEIGVSPLNKNLFSRILENKNNAKLACVFLGKKLVSGCVFIFHKKILDIYMISFDSSYKEIKPNYFCIDNLIRYAKKLGIDYLNWQSSNFIGSGVYNFKKSWGSKHSSYQILTKTFVNFSEIKKIGLNNIINAYPGHYLLPYDAMIKTRKQKIFNKE